MEECGRLYPGNRGLELCESPIDALRGADALIVATEWKAFQGVPLDVIRNALVNPVVFDGRNMLDAHAAAACGLDVIGIGRPRRRSMTQEPRLRGADR